MKIIDRILILQMDFHRTYNLIPNYIYLGRFEKYELSQTYLPYYSNNDTTIAGMKIIEVNEHEWCRVGV